MKKLAHFIKLAWSVSPSYILLLAGNSVCNAAKVILNIVLPMYLINELLEARDVQQLLIYGSLIVLNNVGMTFLTNTFTRFTSVKESETENGMMKLMSEKIMNLEYSYLENPQYLDLKERAVFAVQNQNTIANLINAAAEVFSGAVTLTGLAAILITLGPVLVIMLLAGVVIMLLIYRGVSKYQAMAMQQIIPFNRRFGYYYDLGMGKEAQKDIRLYNMEGMITNRVIEFSNEVCDVLETVQLRMGKAMGEMSAVSEGISAFSYAYVGIRTISTVLGPKLSIGALTMYVSAAINFSSMVSKFGESIVMMLQFLSFLDPYMEFMSLPEETKQSGKEPFSGEVETVEFRNVTFSYPNAEKPVLKDISFSIHKGEKISIVGLNGAGKSTLVKLICRMYQTDSGEILINGKNIYDYDYMSYMNCISAVFQDYRLFNFTIEENICCEGATVSQSIAADRNATSSQSIAADRNVSSSQSIAADRNVSSSQSIAADRSASSSQEKIYRLMEEVGLKEKIAELPNGMKSRFGKDYDEEGIEMSGGQGQKIAIARALYKKASMVILDEPASALDPIAEAEIYEKFNSLVADKTAIYISHRMSSSVFCDKILIIDGGTVADYDTHENLMKKTESLYYKLFHSQAENYRLVVEGV